MIEIGVGKPFDQVLIIQVDHHQVDQVFMIVLHDQAVQAALQSGEEIPPLEPLHSQLYEDPTILTAVGIPELQRFVGWLVCGVAYDTQLPFVIALALQFTLAAQPRPRQVRVHCHQEFGTGESKVTLGTH